MNKNDEAISEDSVALICKKFDSFPQIFAICITNSQIRRFENSIYYGMNL